MGAPTYSGAAHQMVRKPRSATEAAESAESEVDGAPNDMSVTDCDIIGFVYSIFGHLVDVAVDVNVAVRYYVNDAMPAFWWTLAFLLLPQFVNTCVSVKMYAESNEKSNSLSKKMTKRTLLRVLVLLFQMAPILKYIDALRFAIKSRRAEKEGDTVAQKKYYRYMLREDSDAALLRVFECFLEAAPQQVLQLSLMIEGKEEFKIHQTLSVISSVISIGWGLAAYQRAIRFAQEDKDNISWIGSITQFLWHFLITVSRVMSIAVVAYLFPLWAVTACTIHALVMILWLQFFEKSPFCSDFLYGIAFSLIMGVVYIFTYIMPVEGRTRYRYTLYYSICFIEDAICTALWILFSNDDIKSSSFYNPIIIVSTVPYMIGVMFLILYYKCLHPRIGLIPKYHRNKIVDSSGPIRETVI